MTFLSSKKPPFEKITSPNDKTNVSFTEGKTQKIFGIFDHNHGLTLFENANFWTIEKRHFYRIKSLPLRKQNHETTIPRSLLQKGRHERYLEFLTRIMG